MIVPMNLGNLPAVDGDSERVNVVIDTPQKSRNKYKYDEQRGLFELSKVLPLGDYFPYNFGFIPSTQGEDGDPLDVVVLMDEPAFVGCLIPARIIGVIEAEQSADGGMERNDRLVAVPDTKHNPAPIQSLKEVASHKLDELEEFFISYNRVEGKEFKPLGRHGPKRAMKLLEAGLSAANR